MGKGKQVGLYVQPIHILPALARIAIAVHRHPGQAHILAQHGEEELRPGPAEGRWDEGPAGRAVEEEEAAEAVEGVPQRLRAVEHAQPRADVAAAVSAAEPLEGAAGSLLDAVQEEGPAVVERAVDDDDDVVAAVGREAHGQQEEEVVLAKSLGLGKGVEDERVRVGRVGHVGSTRCDGLVQDELKFLEKVTHLGS